MPSSFLASSNVRSIQYRCVWKPAYSFGVNLSMSPLLKLYFILGLFSIVFVITKVLLRAFGSAPSQTHISSVWTSSFSHPLAVFLIFSFFQSLFFNEPVYSSCLVESPLDCNLTGVLPLPGFLAGKDTPGFLKKTRSSLCT